MQRAPCFFRLGFRQVLVKLLVVRDAFQRGTILGQLAVEL
jgi:hypothetical protein